MLVKNIAVALLAVSAPAISLAANNFQVQANAGVGVAANRRSFDLFAFFDAKLSPSQILNEYQGDWNKFLTEAIDRAAGVEVKTRNAIVNEVSYIKDITPDAYMSEYYGHSKAKSPKQEHRHHKYDNNDFGKQLRHAKHDAMKVSKKYRGQKDDKEEYHEEKKNDYEVTTSTHYEVPASKPEEKKHYEPPVPPCEDGEYCEHEVKEHHKKRLSILKDLAGEAIKERKYKKDHKGSHYNKQQHHRGPHREHEQHYDEPATTTDYPAPATTEYPAVDAATTTSYPEEPTTTAYPSSTTAAYPSSTTTTASSYPESSTTTVWTTTTSTVSSPTTTISKPTTAPTQGSFDNAFSVVPNDENDAARIAETAFNPLFLLIVILPIILQL